VASAADPRIIVLDRFVPWQEVLISLSADALYTVYPSAGTWRCQVVPAAIGKPAARKRSTAARRRAPRRGGGTGGTAPGGGTQA